MMKSKITYHFAIFVVLLFLFQSSCTDPAEKNICSEVSIKTATLNAEPLFLSDYVEGEIEYIKLESKDECLLDNNIRLYSNDSVIIAITDDNIFLFDRNTGNFIKEIGEYSRSPEGYMENIYAYPYDEFRNRFYAKGWIPNSFYEYNIDGQLINKIIPPLNNYSVTSLVPANDSLYYGFIWNYDGKQDIKLVALDSNNKIIKTYPQYQHFDFEMGRDQIEVYNWDGWFYKYNDALYVYESFSDTVFSINNQGNLIPKYIFKNQDLGAPYNVRFSPNFNPMEYYRITSIFESDSFLFVTYKFRNNDFLGLYNKQNGRTLASPDSLGIINDIDNIFSFRFYSLNNQNEIIGYKHAYEVLKWLEEQPEEKIDRLPGKFQKLRTLKEADNPVVMIAKLKE